jgi:hypothetical protein
MRPFDGTVEMRFIFIVTLVFATSTVVSGDQGRAAPRSSSSNVEVVHKGHDWRHYYRRRGDDWRRYYRPLTPPTPVRPLSCGEFRFWDGERCVDVRFR